jgi:hypothetical protein
MKKHQSGGLLTLLLEIIALLIIVVGAYVYVRVNSDFLSQVLPGSSEVAVVTSGKCGLTVTSHSPKSKVGFPLVIKGVVDNSNSKADGCSWQMFEGQAGIAQIYFKSNDNEWKKIGESKPVIAENWTSVNSLFSVGLNFNNEGVGLPNSTELKVVFTEENASGMPPVDTYELPLILDTTLSRAVTGDKTAQPPSESMSLTLYIQDKEIAKTRDCGVTKKAIYQVPRTSAVVDSSLQILFESELSKYGAYKSVSVADGVAKVMLVSENTPEGHPIGGLSSCESSHLMSVLKDTLIQYKTVKSVELYSPKGKILF